MNKLTVFFRIAVLCSGILLGTHPIYGQSVNEGGHPTITGHAVFAGWNFKAGKDMAENPKDFSEYRPFLQGWDFRINLPHVRFQLAKSGQGSGPVMVGVIENSSDFTQGTLKEYGHTNNSIWLFQTLQSDNQVHYKVLPSRREMNSSKTENINSLKSNWKRVKPATGSWYVWFNGTGKRQEINKSILSLSKLAFGDFNGDGKADLFRADGSAWYVSFSGTSKWHQLRKSQQQLSDLAFGDFNGDNITDVFRVQTNKNEWLVSFGGTSKWQKLRNSHAQQKKLGFGDFDGDGKTDVFRADGSAWYVSYSGTSKWHQLRKSQQQLSDLAFGDFNGDNITDVFRVQTNKNEWLVSFGGTSKWQKLRNSHAQQKNLGFGDFDGDGKTDVFRADGSVWYVSYSGTSNWQQLKSSSIRLENLAFGDFDGSGKTDVFRAVGSKKFRQEKIAASVVGEGIGNATIYLVARAKDNTLWFTKRLMSSTDVSSWPEAWSPLDISSTDRPALVAAFDHKLALAWRDQATERIMARIYFPDKDAWGPTVEIPESSVGAPQLLWDGTTLNLFFVSKQSPTLQHSFARNADPLVFKNQVSVNPLLAVRENHFDAMVFNTRLHVVIHQHTGEKGPTRVFYTTSTTDFGKRSQWTIPSETGLITKAAPVITFLNDNIFVIAIGAHGSVRYSRKDPNSPGNDITGGSHSDRWLDAGERLDQKADEKFSVLEALSFNGDIYLAARTRNPSNSVYLVNFSRAAMKTLIEKKLGIEMIWGSPGARERAVQRKNGKDVIFFAKSSKSEIAHTGDFDGDGRDDIIQFKQTDNSTVGPASVHVAIASGEIFVNFDKWHESFSFKGEIPMVGDFNGDGKDDIITFTQQKQKDAQGKAIGPAVVWVALSDGSKFKKKEVWHKSFSFKGEIPMVGDFNDDGRDDIITFTQQRQKDAQGKVIGPAAGWVALSDGTKFKKKEVWHKSFSFKGEIPMVGDFNGDGRDDIITFTQQQQNDAQGKVIGPAVVWVALSDGTKFKKREVWHRSFSHKGEIPLVGDFNQDGKDDMVSFAGEKVYVAFALGDHFGRAMLLHSDFLQNTDQIPMVASFSGQTLKNFTALPVKDRERRFSDLFAFDMKAGKVIIAQPLFQFPVPSGAPWERYKWFTDKGLGVTTFPERFWEDSFCLSQDHVFALFGFAGNGGLGQTGLSVKSGSRQDHVLEELGHSVFDLCLDDNKDPFNFYKAIYETSIEDGGIDASNKPGCTDGFYDCRDPEHYFLKLLIRYRLQGDDFRARITSSNITQKEKKQLRAQYNWIKKNWFNGVEFKGSAANGDFAPAGLQCLPGQCK